MPGLFRFMKIDSKLVISTVIGGVLVWALTTYWLPGFFEQSSETEQ
ncbi:MAG: hypothetical protein AAFY01_01680 [Pseudomonadota bacterium]